MTALSPLLLPHHDGSSLYVRDAPRAGGLVRLRLRVPVGYGPVAGVSLRSNPDHEPAWSTATRLGVVGGWEWWEAELSIVNPRQGYRWLLRHESGRTEWLNQAGLSRIETQDADDFALVAAFDAPAWLHESVVYQIFPDRFARSAAADEHDAPDWAIPVAWDEPLDPVMPGRGGQFYGGDLDGVVDRLDHLADLGIDVLYLTPVFPAASNHRYDASSFDRVDPLLGGDDALIRLVEAAHARGMRVMGDLTTNHSGDRHEWFQAAHGDPSSPETAFYYFTDDDNLEYVGWLGTPTLPKFDWASQELRDRFIEGPASVVGRWLQAPFHLDGWRIDVANMTGRLGDVDLNEQVRRVVRRTMVDVNPDTALLAESTNDIGRDFQGDAWHGAMTYAAFTRPLWGWLSRPGTDEYLTAEGDLRTDPWFFGQPLDGYPQYTAREFVEALTRFSANIPWQVRRGNLLALDSHDTARFATFTDEVGVAIGTTLALTLPGVPLVFAGDEFGLTGIDGEMSRTPMPWDRIDEPDVRERRALYRELIAIRRTHPALTEGGLRWLHVDEDSFAFVRETAAEAVVVFAGRSAADVALPAAAISGPAQRLFGDAVLEQDGGTTRVRADGPGATVWTLPGVAVPESAVPE